jgi:hypothetical protein
MEYGGSFSIWFLAVMSSREARLIMSVISLYHLSSHWVPMCHERRLGLYAMGERSVCVFVRSVQIMLGLFSSSL